MNIVCPSEATNLKDEQVDAPQVTQMPLTTSGSSQTISFSSAQMVTSVASQTDKPQSKCSRFFNCNKRSRNKVPRITAFFWIVKVVATTFGEVLSDSIDGWLPGAPGIALSVAVFLLGVPLNVFIDHYNPFLYWFTVSIISVVGTQLTDMTDYPQVEVPVGVLLICTVFWRWYANEGTVDVKTIYVRRREAWYWLCVCVTFTTGTALGDMMADDAGLSYWQSTLFFLGVFLLDVILWFFFKLHPIFAFWFAYVLTRPMGTNFGDYLEGHFGIDGVSWVFFCYFVCVCEFPPSHQIRHL